jgi:tRNA pseudouridine38-40 synthase
MRYFVELSYDGAAYHGWQVQDGAVSVQEILEKALRFKAGVSERITGCGRTDTGVHARQFFAHFNLDTDLNADQLLSLVFELNRFVPNDIAILQVFRVNESAHTRFDALARTYKYYINFKKNPFTDNYAWSYQVNFDVNKMNSAAATLLEYTDFTSFAKLHTDVKTNNCKISAAYWEQLETQLVFTVTADRFLRNMVRAIVGTLVEVGRGKLSVDDVHRIIQSKNRSNAGMSVPAKGLFLEKIEYDWEQIILKP